MRIKHFIEDAQTQSKVLALAEARHLPVRQDGAWVEFYAVNDPELVELVMKAADLPTPALA